MRISLLALALAVASLPAFAADISVPGADDPKPLRHDSGLRPAPSRSEFDPAARWREHNDRVRELGGHMGHVRNPDRTPADVQRARDGKR